MKKIKITAYQQIKQKSDKLLFEGTLLCANCGHISQCHNSRFCKPIIFNMLENCDNICKFTTAYNNETDVFSVTVILDKKRAAAQNLVRSAIYAIRGTNHRQ